MQEMIELSKQATALPDTPPRLVKYTADGEFHTLLAGPAQFGLPLENGAAVSSGAVIADPVEGCTTLKNEADFWGKIAVVERGKCMFVGKSSIHRQVISSSTL